MKSIVTFKIKDPIETPKNEFELVISYMHGDADGDSERVYNYTLDQTDELKRDIAALMHYDDSDTDMVEYFEAQGSEEPEEDADEFSDNFREGDMTNDGCTDAVVDGVELFWYDANGLKHEVEFKVEDGE